MMSGFLVSFIENWKITLLMIAAGPVLALVQGIADKVMTQQFSRLLLIISGIKRTKKWWKGVRDLNSRNLNYKTSALTTELTRLT